MFAEWVVVIVVVMVVVVVCGRWCIIKVAVAVVTGNGEPLVVVCVGGESREPFRAVMGPWHVLLY